MSRRAAAYVLVLGAVACGARPLDMVTPVDPAPPLGLSAELNVDLRAQGGESASARALLWVGAEPPGPGRPGGTPVVLDEDAGDGITVNGVPVVGTVADWGYLYQAHSLTEPADGRWLFRLTVRGRVVEVPVSVRRSRFVDFPAGPVAVSPGITLRWSPAFPAENRVQAYLTSCSLGDAIIEIGLDRFSYLGGNLSGERCASHALVIASQSQRLGAPFDGGSVSTSVWLDQPIELVP
jgi:hypothetical protein